MSAMKERVREIPAGEFKAKCLQLMDEVQKLDRPLVVTKRGKPVVKVIPCDTTRKSPYGYMKGSVKILGDIISPIKVKWDADV